MSLELPKRSSTLIDGSDIPEIEARLNAAVEDLQSRTSAVAEAKQIQKFALQTERGLEAKYMAPYLIAGKNLSVARILAKADEGYQRELTELKDIFQKAQKHIEEYEVAGRRFDAARSLLSMAKAQLPAAFHQQRGQT